MTRAHLTSDDPLIFERRGESLRPLALLSLVLASFTVNIIVGLAYRFRGVAQLEADEAEYYQIATGLLAGDVEIGGRRTLGFPLILAVARTVRDDPLFVQIVTTTIYSAAAPLLALLVKRVGGSNRSAVFAALLLIVWPPGVFCGTSLYSESVALPAFVAVLVCLPAGSRLHGRSGGVRIGRCLAAGLLLAAVTHVRTMYQLFLPFLVLIALVEERRLRMAATRVGLVLAAFLMGILPWSFAVSTELGRFVFVTANGGETLAGAMTPRLLRGDEIPDKVVAGRSAWIGPGKWVPVAETGYLGPDELKLPYVEQDALLRSRALAWMKNNPGDAALLETAKVGYMWGVYPLARNSVGQLLFGNLPTVALLLLAVLLVVGNPRRAFPLVRLWSLPIFVTCIALVSWGSWRFRQSGDAGLIGLCACLALDRRRYARPRPAST